MKKDEKKKKKTKETSRSEIENLWSVCNLALP